MRRLWARRAVIADHEVRDEIASGDELQGSKVGCNSEAFDRRAARPMNGNYRFMELDALPLAFGDRQAELRGRGNAIVVACFEIEWPTRLSCDPDAQAMVRRDNPDNRRGIDDRIEAVERCHRPTVRDDPIQHRPNQHPLHGPEIVCPNQRDTAAIGEDKVC